MRFSAIRCFAISSGRKRHSLASPRTGISARTSPMAASSEGGDGAFVSGSYFPVLGLTPAAGRLLGPNDEREQGGGNVVVLSEEYWRRRFGAREDVINQPLLVNGQALTIVGVAPRGFHGTTIGLRPLFFVPISMRDARPAANEGGRRAPRVLDVSLRTPEAGGLARTGAGSVERALPLHHHRGGGAAPERDERSHAREIPRTRNAARAGRSRPEPVPDEARQPLTLLFSVTIIVLLICCANVANLLLGRAARRSTEMAVRLSIGAGRKHIVDPASHRIAAAGGRRRRRGAARRALDIGGHVAAAA